MFSAYMQEVNLKVL